MGIARSSEAGRIGGVLASDSMKAMTGLILLALGLPASAVEVGMAFGEKIPPFCFPLTNSSSWR